MTVELPAVAAGLPVAASFALAGAMISLRQGRRRSSLNQAVHELRRPLQALSLALPEQRAANAAAHSSLRLAAAALDRLDREVNGSSLVDAHVPLSPHTLLEEGVGRWKAQAALAGGSVRLVWRGEEVCIEANRFELSQAVDNLISNAIEHGGGKVTVEGRRTGAWLTISVRDSGGSGVARPPGRSGRRRRGHGLRVVARAAHCHGGSFRLQRRVEGMEATLRLPLPIWQGRR